MAIKECVILAYSGGLDTSAILRWLVEEGYEVIALCLNLGQRTENLNSIEVNGKKAGASKVIIQDVQKEFVRDYILPSIQMNAVYEGHYLLGTALSRPLIAKKQIECAKKYGTTSVAHGATGKGNDQVRFELGYYALMPEVNIIAPWKIEEFYTQYPGRKELLKYVQKHNIPVKATQERTWGSDENLMHICFAGGVLENTWAKPPAELFEFTVSPEQAPDNVTEIEIAFKDGIPIKLNDMSFSPTRILVELNKLGGKNGIGRVDMVESRFIGMKGREIYETPGGSILLIAHRAIESLTLPREVIELKDSLMPRFAQQVYNGFWFSPQMELLLNLIKQSQQGVTGVVRMSLYKGNIVVTGRKSPYSLYDEDMVSMEKNQAGYNISDANGFINLHALPLKLYYKVKQNRLQL